ncbi:chemotaxis protein CheB [Wenxinia saemankumensis]|uniref:protein-glutamate methylesterase n=1 Tax=Wenxinia saemankumensis TaxID=1447782 RepID=A0A1M6DQF6_9RHOB|nr:chemotaxis protein CheB [Wenxinia saemankumensis]SHI75441.1 CheB methylesterase [Wenxinia saemankumensis]
MAASASRPAERPSVLVADRSLSAREAIQSRIEAETSIDVIATARDLTAAYHLSEHLRPAAAIVSADLAAQPEFEVLALLFRGLGTRWILTGHDGTAFTMPAFPASDTRQTTDLIEWVARLGAPHAMPIHRTERKGRLDTPPTSDRSETDELILIGASTGGVDALLTVLGQFPRDCPPTLVVQHTGKAFSAGLARLLNANVAPLVEEASDGVPLRRGAVLIAPGCERHLTIAREPGRVARLADGLAVHGHRPSIDILFRSAVPVGPRVTAALLTGMGRDGAEGLLHLRRAGARTIGQDEATSVVYGMPRVAWEIGAVEYQLPLAAIGPALVRGGTITSTTRR